MRIRRSWVLCVLTIIALVIAVHGARAQSYPYPSQPPAYGPSELPMQQPDAIPGQGQPYGPASYSAQGPMGPTGPVGYAPPGYAPQIPPTGYGPQMPPNGYGPQPAGYYDPMQGAPPQTLGPMPAAPMGEGLAMEGADPFCPSCGGYGCEMCCGCDDFDLKLLRYLLPYGAGGCGMQRWYDVSADWVSLKRDGVGKSQVFTKDGLNGTAVLSSDDLSFDRVSGFRTNFALQLAPGGVLEATYMGTFNWATQKEVTNSIDNLFSVMSDFGNSPFNGFDDTDRADLHRIEYSSGFDSIEMNFRRRWVGPNTRIQGSYLAGVRYMYMEEDFLYVTESPKTTKVAPFNTPGWMHYRTATRNSLTGAQVGGDLWVCIMPGLSIGSEAKVGLYGNRANQHTTIDSYSFTSGPVVEDVTEGAPAFIGDGNVELLWRVNQNWTIRAGYNFLLVDAIALAMDNFNAAPPFVTGQRNPTLHNQTHVFYHGANVGVEWMW